ncbi:hypothetical protein NDI76_02140 [Halogeometricum sp. S1BR25-6]|uniref:DNA methylase N-4/N-6 domain-containing protein n=1 Tax=Halogeometricum salsisoli TaxID=2950536 RepID=A0ABU2G9P9_9EURY|nr:DNA methyltransferase [Halogeometricum sp. S1BR25-6]MDS0297541.1 hypothetical protein [Halogeometricum sp. S1BR25-6]
METWEKLPLNLMDNLAEKETYRRDVYRPIYSIHKWWARRPGCTFRILGLACLTDENTDKDDILTQSPGGNYSGRYLQNQGSEFEDKVILDPFAGGGTTLVELNRLGAQTIGYELNPVAWWTSKKSIDEVDTSRVKNKAEEVLQAVRDDIGHLYETEDPDTGAICESKYILQTQKIPCLTCDEEVQLFGRYKLAKNKKTMPAIVYCPNQDCDDRIFALNHDIRDEETCPNCSHTFDPTDGPYGRGKYTCSNGHKHDVTETLNRIDEMPKFEAFAIQYKKRNGKTAFKEPDSDDRKRIEEATEALNQQKTQLPIPEQPVPEGDKTNTLLNYNYDQFSDLFTPRHLLVHGKLLEEIKSIDHQPTREFLVTAVSRLVEYNSKLCRWEYIGGRATSTFERHAYVTKVQPVECNPLTTFEAYGSFKKFVRIVADAKEYAENPFEKVKENSSVNKYEILGESVSEDRLINLYNKTSERLKEEDESVDYVITDPPYYDNVQYSELSDFFYVWLREGLKQDFEEFQPELVPKAREIVSNRSAGKGEDFFIKSMTNVFSECYRVLKQDGEMVFTYHHNENEAWSVILESIIESGFTITGAYPVQSERDNNMHITNLDNSEYDILIFTNKERSSEETTLKELRQNLFFELQNIITEERKRHDDLAQADLGVILRGKCLYYYSKHYPNVYSDGEEVGIDEALDTVDSVIEQVLEGSVNLPVSIDSLTQAYAAFCQRGSESFDDLNKTLLGKNLNVSDLEDEKLVKGPRDKKEPVPADERVRFIERKLNKNGSDGEALLDIDKVQYLYHLYKTDQNTTEYLKDWKSDDRQELAEFMSEVTGDERYEHVMEMNLSQF